MRKLLVILGKELYLRFTDPTVLFLNLALPLLLAALIQASFGNLTLRRGIPDASIPVGIVNQDRARPPGNLGDFLVHALTTRQGEAPVLSALPRQLFDVRVLDDEAEARRLLEREALVALLIIPPDFSESLLEGHAWLQVYVNDRYKFRGAAFVSVVRSLANSMATGATTVRITAQALARDPRLRADLHAGRLNTTLANLARTAVDPASNPIQVQRISTAEQNDPAFTHYLAAAIAILFVGFWGLNSSASLLEEMARGTFQRMLTTPTRPGIILAGKTLGTYVGGIVQMLMLVGGMAV
ncbi:MAG: ABC transporter permease, partial [Acidobacteria bacterium]|nr:ABC transporter permease [Acidobacteriota bacterium]